MFQRLGSRRAGWFGFELTFVRLIHRSCDISLVFLRQGCGRAIFRQRLAIFSAAAAAASAAAPASLAQLLPLLAFGRRFSRRR